MPGGLVPEEEQKQAILNRAEEQSPAFVFPQEVIDEVLTRRGSGVDDGKYRIYEQFLKNRPAEENARFLREEYGIGGTYPALTDEAGNISESHNGKGIELRRSGENGSKILFSWNRVAKRVSELIAAGRYLTIAEKEHYPVYLAEQQLKKERGKIADEFKAIVGDYNGKREMASERLNAYVLSDCGSRFSQGEKKTYRKRREGDYILPLMRDAMQAVKETDPELSVRAEKMLGILNGSYGEPFEPDGETPPRETEPAPAKSYRFRPRDEVYLYNKKYEVLQLPDDEYSDGDAKLYDPDSPIFVKSFPRGEFERELKADPKNNRYAVDSPDGETPRIYIDGMKRTEVEQAEHIPAPGIHLDSAAFEHSIPHTMRFKQYDFVNGNELYWVTQEPFSPGELRQFANAFRGLGVFSKCYVTTRDLSPYVFEEDLNNDVLAVVTKTSLTAEPYAKAIESAGLKRYCYEPFYAEWDAIRDQYGDNTLVLLKIGDFYELYGKDAETAAGILDFVPSDKEVNFGETVKMCGFPANTELDGNYITALRKKGYDLVLASDEYIDGVRVTKELPALNKAPQKDIETVSKENEPDTGIIPPPVTEPERPQSVAEPGIIHPEIAERHDYVITDENIGVSSPLGRFWNNIAAIETLKKIESENRLATPEEQEILAKYVGWGGLSEYFEETMPGNERLRELLTDGEYSSAMASTLTSFYTPPVVIKAMWKVLENMGFNAGNVLEPSCGIGNFFGTKPESMKAVKCTGVEIDSISGRIARQLYQNANIAIEGYENTRLPDSYFDAAVGNVPFAQLKVNDRKYNRYHFLIHDYFFAKTLDKVRPGGVIAFITSKGTMDKENPGVRRYIAQRAELLGAIRLPDDTFKNAAGTEVTADILFLQKREREIELDTEPDWIYTQPEVFNWTGAGFSMPVNEYFMHHPDMVMGSIEVKNGPHGPEVTCSPFSDYMFDRNGNLRDYYAAYMSFPASLDLGKNLEHAIKNISGFIPEYTYTAPERAEQAESGEIPADPNAPEYGYTVFDGKLYYRETEYMRPIAVPLQTENRIRGMIAIRDSVAELIRRQTEDYSDGDIRDEQNRLNAVYDEFAAKYGRIQDRQNRNAFSDSGKYPLLCSLEVYDGERRFIGKADIFRKRTIKQRTRITAVNTAMEAYTVSLAEKLRVDMPFMEQLTGRPREELLEELKEMVFRNPDFAMGVKGADEFLPYDEYLSGNVREKLRIAKEIVKTDDKYLVNVSALEKVQPKDLTANEITVRIGATWIPLKTYNDFLTEVLNVPRGWNKAEYGVQYSPATNVFRIENKSQPYNVKVTTTYGTSRINALEIMEDTLNLREVKVYDYFYDPETQKNKRVLNTKETQIAQEKQEQLKQAFSDWIWQDPDRRRELCGIYNEKFNSVRPREYDGGNLELDGINPTVELREHQKNGIAHILYGGNTLLAHVIGAGKTYEMVAAAMEMKRLGKCHKSLIVVPNHITEQFASDFLTLYPAANILVATKKDFTAENRRKFFGRIATGDYDAVIIGHSQLIKIPMSHEFRKKNLYTQREDIIRAQVELKNRHGNKWTIKQLEHAKKGIDFELEALNKEDGKDDLVTFEEMGVDMLFIDEAHYFKNLYVKNPCAGSKLRNVAGIAQSPAQKSSDLFMKCQYLNEQNPGRGVVFATGTPISNTMVEMYTLQRYLQYDTLKKMEMTSFDSWAANFGETVAAVEQDVTGNSFQVKTRFARFYNLPELMAMFKEVADIKTADMLNLPVPKANYHNVALKPSEEQKEIVKQLGKRAELIKSGGVDSRNDNMLCITNDGRKLALDQRLLNPLLPESETGKISACAENVYRIWRDTADKSSTQLVFCDISTPKGDGKFNVYDALKEKLADTGIPENEIAFVHGANTEAQKEELFAATRAGKIRVLLGSTEKMGSGTNVQDKLIALHHLDCPWRPSDLQQREGRIIRQGNTNPEVEIYTYVTEGTFDSYLYQMVEAKQKFIGQIMTGKSPVRSAEDIDSTALSYAEIKALCAGNPHVKEKMELDNDVNRLNMLKSAYLAQKYELEDKLATYYPQCVTKCEYSIEGLKKDNETYERCKPLDGSFPPMTLKGKVYTEKKAAGEELLNILKTNTKAAAAEIGEYLGFKMSVALERRTDFTEQVLLGTSVVIRLSGALTYSAEMGTDIYGNITRIDNLIDSLPVRLQKAEAALITTREEMETAKKEIRKPFPREEELKEKTARLASVNALLGIGKSDSEDVINIEAHEIETDEEQPQKESTEPERGKRSIEPER